MAVRRVSPSEAKELLAAGYKYLDVRSVPEYDQGHPDGALNAPLMHMGAGGMAPNADFLAVVGKNFPKDAKLVVGCKSGARSQRAAMMLESAGYSALVEMRGGWGGEPLPTGGMEKGWSQLGYPTSTAPTPGGSWAELAAKK